MTLVPQIWEEVLLKATKHSVDEYAFFAEAMVEWEELHKARMAVDADYAREYEEFEREWAAMGEVEDA